MMGMVLGIAFTDIDIKLNRTFFRFLFQPKSALTHGFFMPLVLLWSSWGNRDNLFRIFTIGFCGGFAVDVAFDLFPGARNWSWYGDMLIKVPGFGPMETTLTVLFLLLTLIISLGIAFFLVRTQAELALLCVVLFLSFLAVRELQTAFWMPLLMVTGISVAAYYATNYLRGRISGQSGWQTGI